MFGQILTRNHKEVVLARVLAALFVLMMLTVSVNPADASTKSNTTKSSKSEEIKCKPTKAKAHSPKVVTPAEVKSKRLPKSITLETNCGDIQITTLASKAPVTVAHMAKLARNGFFDESICHRLINRGAYVLQCGDPTATGKGGPQFVFQDENLPRGAEGNYPEGTVAMWNKGPGTNGSQFFLVYADTTLIKANYTIWGTITEGLEIVKAIAKMGVRGGGLEGAPSQVISIEKVVVSN
jgi:peptidyl-prolyl cis-trans isomerase B (cyclophilin B)